MPAAHGSLYDEPARLRVAGGDQPGEGDQVIAATSRDVPLEIAVVRQCEAIQVECALELSRWGADPGLDHLHMILIGRKPHEGAGQHVDAARSDGAAHIEDGYGVELPLQLEFLCRVAGPFKLREETAPTHEVPRHLDVEGQLTLHFTVDRQAHVGDVGVETEVVGGAREQRRATAQSDRGGGTCDSPDLAVLHLQLPEMKRQDTCPLGEITPS